MKYRQYLTWLITLVFAGLFSCANPASPTSSQFTVTIKGNVIRKNLTPLDSVQLVLSNPSRRDSAISDGSFSVSFSSQEKNPVTATLTFSRLGFYDTTISLTYGTTVNSFNYRMQMKGLTAAVDSVIPARPSLRAGAIVYIGSTVPNLSIYGAGGIDVTTLTYEVRDSVGNPVDTSNQTVVHFLFANTPPDSFTQLSRTSAKTNSTGRAAVILGSGYLAGLAQVEAYVAVKRLTDTTKYDTLRSSITSIPIYGGLPDSNHFTLGSEKLNLPGAIITGVTSRITAIVGDLHGNPVQPGSPVLFGTNGGVITPGSSNTLLDGSVQSTLITGNPVPPGGIVTVTAQMTSGSGASSTAGVSTEAKAVKGKSVSIQPQFTRAEKAFQSRRKIAKVVDEAIAVQENVSQNAKGLSVRGTSAAKVNKLTSGILSRSISVIFSGKTLITSPDSNFIIPSQGSATVHFIVADPNGNPLTSGTSALVSVSGSGLNDVEFSGDLTTTLPDTKDRAYTNFQISLKDKRAPGLNSNEALVVKMDVKSDNGNQSLTIFGRLLGGGNADSGKVGSISLVKTLPDTIVVTGGGGKNSQLVQFKVLDVFNRPAQGVAINFEFTKTVNGGEYLTPVSTTTDAGGIATATIMGGIRSGTVQFVARVKRDSLTTVTSDVKTVYIRTGSIAAIALINVSTQQLSVRSVGGTESATLVFEGRDSLGNAIDFASQTNIKFKLQGDTAGVYISPNPAPTDPVTGRVIATLTSGIHSGVIQVYASAKNDGVLSLPVPITIASGLPDQAHYTSYDLVSNSIKRNLPLIPNLNADFVVAAGDTFANPARFGTAVYLTTNAGIIDASGSLDKLGQAIVNWRYAGNPTPSNGIGYVASRSVNRSGQFVVDTFTVVLSDSSKIYCADNNFTIPVGATKEIDFTVADKNFNPLSLGTTIAVATSGTAASDVAVTGDIARQMVDTRLKADTKFAIYVRDIRPTALSKNEDLNIGITVEGANGKTLLMLRGTLLGSAGAGVDSNSVGRIQLLNTNADTIVVSGVGGNKSKDIQFQAFNIFGLPAKNVRVNFVFAKGLNGGEFLSPTTVLTDTAGLAKTTITSGNGFGEVQVIATAKRDTLTISSEAKVIEIVIPPSARLASQIAFLGATQNDIFVSGVGGTENTTLTYEIRDSLGFAIDKNRRVYTTFAVQFFPNSFSSGGTAPVVIPSSDSTDDVGRVHTTVASGTQAGVVQVVVNILIPGRPLLVSQPVKISVHAGFADPQHFTLAAAQLNFPGLDRAFVQENITAQVADKFSNPVPAGTAVYFNTAHGSIQTGGGDAGLTDANGFVTKTLYSANPFPVPPDTLFGVERGFSRVYARTIGKDSAKVLDSLLILWTGAPEIKSTDTLGNYVIPNGGTAGPYTFTVEDRFGHPMSAGTSITVLADACTVNGDANITMPDTQVGGPGLTSFTVLLKDADPLVTPPAPVPSVLTVIITHPVYGTYKLVIASGTVN